MSHLISIILPAYNAADYISDAISSILAQTFKNFELIIINDGSTDKTEKKIKEFNDPRINYFSNGTNQGLIYVLNKGLALAKGEYIARMDADDLSEPDRLQIQYNFLENHRDIDIVGTNFSYIGKHSEAIHLPEYNYEIAVELLERYPFCHASAMFRQSVYKANRGSGNQLYDPIFKHVEDYELWTRMIKNHKCHNLQLNLYKYRKHENNVSQQSFNEKQPTIQECRKRYLTSSLGLEISERENQIHWCLASNNHNQFTIKEVFEFLLKIQRANKKMNTFEKRTLSKLLGRWLARHYYLSNKFTPAMLPYLFTIKFSLPLKFRLRFSAKCLLNK